MPRALIGSAPGRSIEAPGPGGIDYRGDAAQQRAIDLIGGHFCRHGVWPSVDELQRNLERSGDTFDIRTALEWTDVNLGGMAAYPTGTLTLGGLFRFAGAQADLDHFVRAVDLAYRRYASQTADPRIRRSAFEGRPFRLGSLALRKLYLLLEISMVVFNGGSGGADDKWERAVAGSVKDYRGVESIEDFLAVRAKMIPERRSPRTAVQEVESRLAAEVELRAAAERRRQELRHNWATRAGTIAYFVTLIAVVPIAAFFLVIQAVGAALPSGAIAVGAGVAVGLADWVLGLSVRDAAGGLRGVVSRRAEAWLRHVQYPDETELDQT